MQRFCGHLEFFILGKFAAGIAVHFSRRRADRRRYRELRSAYEGAIRETQESVGAPPAIVREAELRRSFADARMPGWFEGFSRTVATWANYCAVAALLALFLRGPILRGEADHGRRASRGGVAGSSSRPSSGAHR
jgi:hypothetical protein